MRKLIIFVLIALAGCSSERLFPTYHKGDLVYISSDHYAKVIGKPDRCGNYTVETDSGWLMIIDKAILDQYNGE